MEMPERNVADLSPDPAGGDAMEHSRHCQGCLHTLKLSSHELAFSILMDSFHIALNPLNDLVIAAVKAKNPELWKEKICTCFTDSVKRRVKEALDTSCSLQDIFGVFKVIRYRLNDICTYTGGSLLDAGEKERLSLQVQGMKVVRHWAYHGEFVSVPEVHSSLNLLILLLRKLHCGEEIVETLKRFIFQITDILNPESNLQRVLPLSTTLKTMLYRSLGEFEKEFGQYVRAQKQASRLPKNFQTSEEESSDDSFRCLIRNIQKEFSKQSKNGRKVASERAQAQQTRPGMTYSKRCTNVANVRNKCAHNQKLSFEEIICALDDVNQLLTAFKLPSKLTISALESLTSLNEDSEVCCPLSREFGYDEGVCQTRLLRPRVHHFIGRKEELLSLTEVLTSPLPPITNEERARVILILESAGIGKSYLANKIAWSLRSTYQNQKWLNCTDETEITNVPPEIIPLAAPANNEETCSRVKSVVNTTYLDDDSEITVDKWLYVLDDVSSLTVQKVYNMLSRSSYSFIVTTRSTAVKDFFQEEIALLHVVTLKPFSGAESYELLKLKTRSRASDEALSLACKTAETALGNLPLCVSIFASLQFARSRKTGPARLTSAVDETLSFDDWEKIEEEFGDRLHVRGLSGVLQVAVKNVEDRPLVLFVLAKIAVCNCESIPWEVLRGTSRGHSRSAVFSGRDLHADEAFCCLFDDLTKIVDWLFSPSNDETVECCRNTLEELGVITWNKDVNGVHIHSLTLMGVQRMISQNRLFFPKLLSFAWQSLIYEAGIKHAAEELCDNLLIFMMCEVILKGTEIMSSAYFKNEGHSLLESDEPMIMFNFLANILLNKVLCRVFKKTRTLPDDFRLSLFLYLQSVIASCLFDSSCIFPQGELDTRLNFWINHYQAFPLRKEQLKKMLRLHKKILAADNMLCVGPKAIFGNSEIFNHMEEANCEMTISDHCVLAELIQRRYGADARNLYLQEVYLQFPRLALEPNINDMRLYLQKIRGVKTSGTFSDTKWPCCFDHEHLSLSGWLTLIHFRIQDEKSGNDKLGKNTEMAAQLLIEINQERQKSYLESANVSNSSKGGMVSKLLYISKLLHFVAASVSESSTWNLLGKPGKSLRVIARAIRLSFSDIEENVYSKEIMELPGGLDVCSRVVYTLMKVVRDVTPDVYHPQLTKDLLGKLYPFFEWTCQNLEHKEKAHHTMENTERSSSSDLEQCSMKRGNILYLWGMSTLCSTFDTKRSLNLILCSFRNQIHCFPQPLKGFCGCLKKAGTMLPMLCALLGQQVALDVHSDMSTLLQDKRSSPAQKEFIHKLITNVKDISQITEAEDVWKTFSQTLQTLQQEDYLSARRSALSCWRGLVSLQYLILARNHLAEDCCLAIVGTMFFRLAECLREIYSHEEKYGAVEYFCIGLLKVANIRKTLFLAAKYQSFYVDYLRSTKQWKEALDQARLLQVYLTEEFGEDYLDWLDDAPNAAALCEELERLTQT